MIPYRFSIKWFHKKDLRLLTDRELKKAYDFLKASTFRKGKQYLTLAEHEIERRKKNESTKPDFKTRQYSD